MFAGKAGANPTGNLLLGRLLALPANITLGWTATNTLVSLVYLQVTKKKGFVNTVPGTLS